jgi:hypothetical protein
LLSQVHIGTLMNVFTTRYVDLLTIQIMYKKLIALLKSILPLTSNIRTTKSSDRLR